MDEKKAPKRETFLLSRRRILLFAAFALSIAVIVVFGIRAFHQVPRRKSSERIRPWMSIKYVAHSHRVPPHVLYEALGLPPKPQDKRSIKQIARSQNLPVDEVIIALQQAIERAKPPSPPAPSTSPEQRPTSR